MGVNSFFNPKSLTMFLKLAHTRTEIYQQSQQLIIACYKLTTIFPNEEKFAMVSQIRRAAVSVHLNVAEGCSRKSLAERKRFFEIARGSVIEIDAALDVATQLDYCNAEAMENAGHLLINNFKQLSALINKV